MIRCECGKEASPSDDIDGTYFEYECPDPDCVYGRFQVKQEVRKMTELLDSALLNRNQLNDLSIEMLKAYEQSVWTSMKEAENIRKYKELMEDK